jgi:hypothetical protein
MFIFNLCIILSILFFGIFKKRLPSLKTLGNLIEFVIGYLIIFALILSVINYFSWKNNEVSKYLLPPYSSFIYIFRYSWQHYWASSVITILFALIVFWGIKWLNKKFNDTFFYDEEPYLAALGILVTSWPNCLIFLSLVLFLGVISHLIILFFDSIMSKRAKRGSLRNAQTAERAGVLSEAKKSEVVCASSKIHARDFGTFSKASPFRLSLLYFWLPCALLVLLLGGIISKYLPINQFII